MLQNTLDTLNSKWLVYCGSKGWNIVSPVGTIAFNGGGNSSSEHTNPHRSLETEINTTVPKEINIFSDNPDEIFDTYVRELDKVLDNTPQNGKKLFVKPQVFKHMENNENGGSIFAEFFYAYANL